MMGLSNMSAVVGLRGSQHACVVSAAQQHHANLEPTVILKTRSREWSKGTHPLLAQAVKLRRAVVGWQGWR